MCSYNYHRGFFFFFFFFYYLHLFDSLIPKTGLQWVGIAIVLGHQPRYLLPKKKPYLKSNSGHYSHTRRTVNQYNKLHPLTYISKFAGPCQFFFDEAFVQLLGDMRIHIRFNITYDCGKFHNRLGVVDAYRITPQIDRQPGEHKVCVTATDSRGRVFHDNIDICHLLPQPPSHKGQSFIVLPTKECSYYRGVFVASRVERSSGRITVLGSTKEYNQTFLKQGTVRVIPWAEKV